MKSRTGYVDTPSAGDFDLSVSQGSTIAGSPATVIAEIDRQIERLGINYLICYFMFGNMKLSDALRSMELFSQEVRPNVRATSGAVASQ